MNPQLRTYDFLPSRSPRIVGGPEALSRLPVSAGDLEIGRAAIITSPSFAGEKRVLKIVQNLLGDRVVATFTRVQPHSPIEIVQEVVRLVDDYHIDTVVSLGGGSSIDTAKGAVWYSDLASTEASIKHIAIPSTFSGAEYTKDAGITFPDGKRVHRDERIVPDLVMLDPDVVKTVPLQFLKTSLLNALAHCLEGMVSIASSPMTDSAYIHAIRLLNESHKQLHTNLGIYLAQAGAALSAMHQVPVGLAHALVHVIGGKFKTPHAVTHAIVGPAVMRFNLPAVADQQRQIAEAFGIQTADLSSEQAAWEAVNAVQSIARNLGIPPGLRDLGVPEERLWEVAGDAPNDPCFPTNPRKIESVDESMIPLRWAWSGDIPEP